MRSLVEISTNLNEHFVPDRNWVSNTKKEFCARCNKLLRERYPKSVDVKLKNYPKNIIGAYCGDIGLTVYHNDFIDQIKQCMPDFVFGKCYDRKDRLISNYVTCYSPHTIVIHGIYVREGKVSKFVECPVCHQLTGCGSTAEIHYVLESELSDQLVYQDGYGDLYLDTALADQVDFSPWPDAVFNSVIVKDRPEPGHEVPWIPPR